MLTLSQTKEFLVVEDEADDALLQMLIDTAEEYIADYIGCAIPDPAPLVLKLAALHMVSLWHGQRTPIAFASANKIPATAQLLLDQHREVL